MIDSKAKGRTGEKEADDVDAYDLILKDKEKLLSFEEPTRFIFSHSALREGWDNPNIFVICTLKQSDNTISKRQEVGRGLRISVNQYGERQDDPSTVHEKNVLTVVANESYEDFVKGLQTEIADSLSHRPDKIDAKYFENKVLHTRNGKKVIDSTFARQIEYYLIMNQYIDIDGKITEKYTSDKASGKLADMPEQLKPYQLEIHTLIEQGVSASALPEIENERNIKVNPFNKTNFDKIEFQELWKRIKTKAIYQVNFDTEELIEKCIHSLNKNLAVSYSKYRVQRGQQKDNLSAKELKEGEGFTLHSADTLENAASTHSHIAYDLIGKIVEGVTLTRRTVSIILKGILPQKFDQYKMNPEQFISKSIELINEQKATTIINKLSYDRISEQFTDDIFTANQAMHDFSKAKELKKHVYNYAITDSKVESELVNKLEEGNEVVVYAKLPRGFYIPTPVGKYNPDWAIAFDKDKTKYIYFVAETKGSLSSMQLKPIEQIKIECAKKFFQNFDIDNGTSSVKYDVITKYDELLDIIKK